MCDICSNPMRDLGLSIADHSRREEFHQKRGEYIMYDYHKAHRLALEKRYRALKMHKKETAYE